jgi:hypothetical protein
MTSSLKVHILRTVTDAGYAEMATYRSLMTYMYEPNRDIHEEVELDGVGT